MNSRQGRGWAYIGALLGGAVSIAANIAHSYVPPAEVTKAIEAAARTGVKVPDWSPNIGAVIGAVFWPVALFVAVEIFARIAWPDGRRWTALRFLGLLPVALVAAVVSYRHLSGLLSFYREDALTATIGPLAVDGLMVMATGALIATGPRRTVPDALPVAAPVAAPIAAPPADAVDQEQPAVSPEQPAPMAAPRRPVRRPTAADRVAKAATRTPAATPAQLAARLKLSERTVQRYLPRPADDTTPPAQQPSQPVNGRTPELAEVVL